MRSKLRLFCICLLSSFFCSVSYAIDEKQAEVNELQVLIDVSGSMKKNDPDNLRIPAIKLLINLLPDGTRVGLWLFAENTIALVKTGVVDEKWKKEALFKVNKIHSSGLFTNIEDAIHTSTQKWIKSTAQHNRNLILLTDGVVDISKDIMQSAESRERIMSEQIALLQQAGIKVQTIALSDDVDAELLEKLAFDTGGWSETVLSAEQLQKIFFKLFKQAVPQDTLPILDNYFTVDNTVKELSVLIFKTQDATESQLISPEKEKISSRSKLNNLSWLNEKNYDLVTIKNPKPGEWKILAEMDPENQVMIVTDLKFEVNKLASHILLSESLDVTGFFTDQQQLITRKDFLSLIDISIQQVDGKRWDMPVVIGRQGFFNQSLEGELNRGRHILKIIADGKTFKREVTKTIEVMESLVTMEKELDLKERTVMIKLKPVHSTININRSVITVNISHEGGQTESFEMDKVGEQWQLLIKVPKGGKSKIVNFSVIAMTTQGNTVSPNIPPLVIDEGLFVKAKIKDQRAEPIKKGTYTPKKKEQLVDENKDISSPVNWMETSMIILFLNIFLMMACFFGFKFVKKQMASKQTQLLSRLD